MNSIKIFMNWFLFVSTISLDPDVDICDRKTFTGLNASVNSFDGNTYLFRGDYYWKTLPLDSQKGIVGYADLIANKWPEINDSIIASFTLKPKTVFVCEKNWFAYEGTKVTVGSTDNWPNFKDLNIDTMFRTNLMDTKVYVIYNNSFNFLVYNLNDLSNPKVESTGITVANKDSLWFLDKLSESEKQKSGRTLRNVLKVNASITYPNGTLVLMSNKKYCRVNVLALKYDKRCDSSEVFESLINCPLDLAKRPTTTTPKVSPTLNDSTIKTTPEKPSFAKNGSPTDEPIDDEFESNDGNKSIVIFAIIIGVVVVIVIAVIIAIIILVFTMNSGDKKVEPFNSRVTLGTITTLDSKTGQPARSPSITSLAQSNRGN